MFLFFNHTVTANPSCPKGDEVNCPKTDGKADQLLRGTAIRTVPPVFLYEDFIGIPIS